MGAPIAYAAATLAASAYSAVQENRAAKTQQIISDAATTANVAQSRLQAARQGERAAINFRQAFAQQVALASMRGGSGSLVSQFSAQSLSNFARDQQAVQQSIRYAGIQGQNQYAQSAAQRSITSNRGIANFVQTGLNVYSPALLSSALNNREDNGA
jgi:hypothetical protein